MDYNEFWNRTNKLIKKAGKTQSSLSCECGFTERRINNLSAANRSPSIDEVIKIASALNTTVEFLVIGKKIKITKDDVLEYLQENLL